MNKMSCFRHGFSSVKNLFPIIPHHQHRFSSFLATFPPVSYRAEKHPNIPSSSSPSPSSSSSSTVSIAMAPPPPGTSSLKRRREPHRAERRRMLRIILPLAEEMGRATLRVARENGQIGAEPDGMEQEEEERWAREVGQEVGAVCGSNNILTQRMLGRGGGGVTAFGGGRAVPIDRLAKLRWAEDKQESVRKRLYEFEKKPNKIDKETEIIQLNKSTSSSSSSLRCSASPPFSSSLSQPICTTKSHYLSTPPSLCSGFRLLSSASSSSHGVVNIVSVPPSVSDRVRKHYRLKSSEYHKHVRLDIDDIRRAKVDWNVFLHAFPIFERECLQPRLLAVTLPPVPSDTLVSTPPSRNRDRYLTGRSSVSCSSQSQPLVLRPIDTPEQLYNHLSLLLPPATTHIPHQWSSVSSPASPRLKIIVDFQDAAGWPPPMPKCLANVPDYKQTNSYQMLSFYRFAQVDEPEKLTRKLRFLWLPMGVVGRVYVAPEGINGQVAVPVVTMDNFRQSCDELDILRNIHLNKETTIPNWNNNDKNNTLATRHTSTSSQHDAHTQNNNIDTQPHLQQDTNNNHDNNNSIHVATQRHGQTTNTINIPIQPYRRLHIRHREQLVTAPQLPQLDWSKSGTALTPKQWHRAIAQGRVQDDEEITDATQHGTVGKSCFSDEHCGNNNYVNSNNNVGNKGMVVVDCRNEYESDIGHFVDSTPMNTQTFKQAYQALDRIVQQQRQQQKQPQQREASTKGEDDEEDGADGQSGSVGDEEMGPLLLYCTGGIRCIKAGAYAVQRLGCKKVYTLKGGIVAYQNYMKTLHDEHTRTTEDCKEGGGSSGSSTLEEDGCVTAKTTTTTLTKPDRRDDESVFLGKNYVFDNRLVSDAPTTIGGEGVTAGCRTVKDKQFVGRSGDADVAEISACHTCGMPSDRYRNCSNEKCHILFLQCASCLTGCYGGCCCLACRQLKISSSSHHQSFHRHRDSTATCEADGVGGGCVDIATRLPPRSSSVTSLGTTGDVVGTTTAAAATTSRTEATEETATSETTTAATTETAATTAETTAAATATTISATSTVGTTGGRAVSSLCGGPRVRVVGLRESPCGGNSLPVGCSLHASRMNGGERVEGWGQYDDGGERSVDFARIDDANPETSDSYVRSANSNLHSEALSWTSRRSSAPLADLLEDVVLQTNVTFPQLARPPNNPSKHSLMCDTLQGCVLSALSAMRRPRHILELGSFTGYSALCLLEGLRPGGCFLTVDRDRRASKMASKFLEQYRKLRRERGEGSAVTSTIEEETANPRGEYVRVAGSPSSSMLSVCDTVENVLKRITCKVCSSDVVSKQPMVPNSVDSYSGGQRIPPSSLSSTDQTGERFDPTPADDWLSSVPESGYDLIYMDADKRSYLQYYKTITTRITASGKQQHSILSWPNGVLIVDNVLWMECNHSSGNNKKLHNQQIKTCMEEFNRHVRNDPKVEQAVLPLRDGLSMIRWIQ
eukprot:GHVS01097939.1.p1 GENE.GHVS01097939.1~~GHVS01097939.1.p1  ORF type:complete len:1471 (-),score=324.43 GHVS01097939.1:161-4573(-)